MITGWVKACVGHEREEEIKARMGDGAFLWCEMINSPIFGLCFLLPSQTSL